MTSFRPARLALLALALAVSCTSGEGGVAGVLVVSRVDVEPGVTQVILGQSLQLAATPRTASGISVPGRSVTWSSSDPLIATVSTTGMVNGVALGGPVRIRATVDGVVGDALVTVRSVPVDRVTVTPANSGVLVAAGVQLTAHAFDAGGNPLTGRSFDWESSDPAIAAVTTTGIVIGLAQGGPVTITASAEGKSGSALVSVATRPATRLAFAEQPGPAVAGAPLTPP
ncbi:MAG TPA: Ig-like domain-containing protein, partial [Gemmatimonadales bacterium]|nr:Ig-like domain-containing protein [Gemmatimonadales bacterium]